MKLSEFRAIAVPLCETTDCKFWSHWNKPTTTPWLMAIFSPNDVNNRPVEQPELLKMGFTVKKKGGKFYYVVERSDVPE